MRLVIARTDSSTCRVDVYDGLASTAAAPPPPCGACRRRRAELELPLVTVTAVRGLGVQIDGLRAGRPRFIPIGAIASVFVHEAFHRCRVVATLAIDVAGAERLVLPLEPAAGFAVPLAQLGDAWRELSGALALD